MACTYCKRKGPATSKCWKSPESSKFREDRSRTTRGITKSKKDNHQEKESNKDSAVVSTSSTLSVTERVQGQKPIYDSGKTDHICNFRDLFETFYPQLGWVQVGSRENV